MKMYMDYMNRENAKDNKSLGGTDMVLTEAVDVDPLELTEVSREKIARYVKGVKGELDSGKLHKGSKRWDARLRGVSRGVGKTAEGDLRRQGFGKQGLAKVGATNESLNEGKRWNRVKKAWHNTGHQSSMRAGSSYFRALREPIGKGVTAASAGAHAAVFSPFDPHVAAAMAGIGVGLGGLAAAQKGYRVAKEYRRLKRIGEDVEDLDEAFMDKVRRAKYVLRKATGMQRRSVQKKAEKQAADFDDKHGNPRNRWERAQKVRQGQWRRDDKQRTESPRWALENQLKRVKSSKRKGEIQSELDSVIAKETAHKEKAEKRYKRLNAYDKRTKELIYRDDSLKARARFARTPKTVNNPMYMGQMWSNYQRKHGR